MSTAEPIGFAVVEEIVEELEEPVNMEGAEIAEEIVEEPQPKPKKRASRKHKTEIVEEPTAVVVADEEVKDLPDLDEMFAPAGSDKEYARILIYGRNKTGKTTLGASGGKGTLIIKFEDGTASAIGSGALQYPKSGKLETWEQFEELYWYLKTLADEGRLPFDTIVFDTLTRMRQLVLRHTTLGSAKFDPTKDIITPTQRDYGNAGQRMIYWLEAFNDLPVNIVWLCQERDGSDVEGMEMFEALPDLPTQVRNYVCGDADVIGRTFKRTHAIEASGKAETSFRVQFGASESVMTGDRFSVLPAVAANVNLRTVFAKIAESKTKAKKGEV